MNTITASSVAMSLASRRRRRENERRASQELGSKPKRFPLLYALISHLVLGSLILGSGMLVALAIH